MSTADVTIRPTTPDDLDAICEIYAHHVRTGVATFELDAPTWPSCDDGFSR